MRKKMIVFIYIILNALCMSFSFDKISVGDDISSICKDIEAESYILCGPSRIYPCITIQDGIEQYVIAFSNNLVVAIFYPYVHVNGNRIVAWETKVNDLEKMGIKYELKKETGFGYVYSIDSYDLIVCIGSTGTDRDPSKDDLISMIVKR
ncbi:MAG: hypothetical protein IKR40_09350 [Treponema sp.]|nr:hypothetical protein [Treponema sp.]